MGWGLQDLCETLTAERDAALAQLAAANERLENNHCFDVDGNRIEVEPGSIPDGISARDETIKLVEGRLDAALARVAVLEERGDPWQTMDDYCAEKNDKIIKLFQANKAMGISPMHSTMRHLSGQSVGINAMRSFIQAARKALEASHDA